MLDFVIIFVAQAVYVATTTVRWIIMLKGGRQVAAVISFFVVLLFVYALGMVITHLHNPWKAATYALGYAVGTLVGGQIEERLALGYILYQVITTRIGEPAPRLREHGLGVTVWGAEGQQGPREVLFVVPRRRLSGKVTTLMDRIDPGAFVVQVEPSWSQGGFLQKYLLP